MSVVDVTITAADVWRLTGTWPVTLEGFRALVKDPRVEAELKRRADALRNP